jgi:hypothetical protein
MVTILKVVLSVVGLAIATLILVVVLRYAHHALRLAFLKTLINLRFGGFARWYALPLLPLQWACDLAYMLWCGVPETVCFGIRARNGQKYVGLFFNDLFPCIRRVDVEKYLCYDYVFDFRTVENNRR